MQLKQDWPDLTWPVVRWIADLEPVLKRWVKVCLKMGCDHVEVMHWVLAEQEEEKVLVALVNVAFS